MSYRLAHVGNLGSSKAGLLTPGFALYDTSNVLYAARTVSGVVELGGGYYLGSVIVPDSWQGRIQWDSGDGSPTYWNEAVNPPDAGADRYMGVSFGTSYAGAFGHSYQVLDDAGASVGSHTASQDWGHGWFGARITFPSERFAGAVRWDGELTMESNPAYHVSRADLAPVHYSVGSFGSAYAGLTTPAYTVYAADGSLRAASATTGRADLLGGYYGAPLSYASSFQGHVLWERDPSGSNAYDIVVLNDPTAGTQVFGTPFGSAVLTTVGYKLVDRTGATVRARTTTGLQNWGHGWYGFQVVLPAGFQGAILLDDGLGSPTYYGQAINPVRRSVAAVTVNGVTEPAPIPRRGTKDLTLEQLGGGLVLPAEQDASEIGKSQATDLLNVDVTDEAVSMRLGRARWNSSIPSGMTAEKVRGLYRYYPPSGSPVLLMACGTKVFADTNQDGDFNDAGEAIATGLTGGRPMDFWRVRDRLYFGNGVDAVYRWDGSGAAAAVSVLPTPAALSLAVVPYVNTVQAMETAADWTSSDGAKLSVATSASDDPIKSGSASIKVSAVTKGARNQTLYYDFVTAGLLAQDYSGVEALTLWCYCPDRKVQLQIGVSEGTSAPDWTLFPVISPTDINQWQPLVGSLRGVQPDGRDAVRRIWIRFVDVEEAGGFPVYCYLDVMHAQGPFPPTRYRYYVTVVQETADGLAVLRESAPLGPVELTLSGEPAIEKFRLSLTYDTTAYAAGGTVFYVYRHSDAAPFQRPRRVWRVANSAGAGSVVLSAGDRTADADLVFNDARELKTFGIISPPVARTYCQVGRRTLAGDVLISATRYRDRLYLSRFGAPEEFAAAADPLDLLAGGWIPLPEGDDLLRITDADGKAVLWCERGVYTLDGQDWGDFLLRHRASVGLTAREAVCQVGRLWLFLAQDGVRALDPFSGVASEFSTWRLSEPVDDLLQSIPASYRANACMGLDERGRVVLAFTAEGGTTNAIALVLDPKTAGALDRPVNPIRPGWTYYESWPASCLLQLKRGGGDNGELLGGDPSEGTVWRLNYGHTDDGQPIEWRWQSRSLSAPRGGVLAGAHVAARMDAASGETVVLTTRWERGRYEESSVCELGTRVDGSVEPWAPLSTDATGRDAQIRIGGIHSVAMRCHNLGLGYYAHLR